MSDEIPPCKQEYEHSFFTLGTEDNGEIAARCGNCLTMRYTAPNGAVRYEEPDAAGA